MELNTNVPNLEGMSRFAVEPYDAVYLGMPYCWEFEGNLISNLDDLETAVETLRELNKKAYISTFAAPRNKDLDKVFRLIDRAVELEVDAVEASNLGIVRYVTREFPDMGVHVGGLACVYTTSTAELLYSMGVRRIMPAYELPLEDIRAIKDIGVEVEIVVHGKIPLGIGERCFLKSFSDAVGKQCPEICREKMWYRSDDLVLKPFGQVTLSGKDVCMYEHLEKVDFVDGLRVESVSEDVDYRIKVGKIYRKRLNGPNFKEDLEILRELAEFGICNGFYFNKAGQIYVSR
jgi:putative protease